LKIFFNVIADVLYIVLGAGSNDLNNLNSLSKILFSNFDQAIFKEGVETPY